MGYDSYLESDPGDSGPEAFVKWITRNTEEIFTGLSILLPGWLGGLASGAGYGASKLKSWLYPDEFLDDLKYANSKAIDDKMQSEREEIHNLVNRIEQNERHLKGLEADFRGALGRFRSGHSSAREFGAKRDDFQRVIEELDECVSDLESDMTKLQKIAGEHRDELDKINQRLNRMVPTLKDNFMRLEHYHRDLNTEWDRLASKNLELDRRVKDLKEIARKPRRILAEMRRL